MVRALFGRAGGGLACKQMFASSGLSKRRACVCQSVGREEEMEGFDVLFPLFSQVEPDDAEEYVEYLMEIYRYDEAARVLVEVCLPGYFSLVTVCQSLSPFVNLCHRLSIFVTVCHSSGHRPRRTVWGLSLLMLWVVAVTGSQS